MHFGFLDIIIAIPFVWAIYRGFTKGFVRQLATLGALILGVYGGAKFSGWLGEFLHNKFNVALKLSQFVSFIIIFIAVLIIMHLLTKIIQNSMKATGMGPLDKILGVLFAMIKALIIVGVILTFFDMINRKIVLVQKQDTEKSFLYSPIIRVTTMAFPSLKFEYNNNK
jgi:membrane protein required for colicin V production